MTRLAFGAFGANNNTIDGLTFGSGVTIVASTFTGGGPYELQVVGSASNISGFLGISQTSNVGYYMRARVRLSGTPAADTLICGFGLSTLATIGNFGIYLASGSMSARLWAGAAVRGVAGPALVANTDYLFEVYALYNATGTLDDTISARINGVTIDTVSGAFATAAPGAIFMGLSANAGITAHYTDWAVNDDQGASDNSWCGDARVAMLLPVATAVAQSDTGADAWRLANSSTTNLFDGVNNTPPIGVASPGTTSPASQIVCDTPSVARNYTANTATYDSVMAAGDTITHVQGVVAHGESITTGTKTGTCDLQANPAGGSTTAITFGNDAGGDGTWPTLWSVSRTPISLAPSVTRSGGVNVRVTAAIATRNSDVCFMGAYVEYVVADTPELRGRPFGLHGQAQMHQLLSQ